MPTYNHMFDIAFSLESEDCDAKDVTPTKWRNETMTLFNVVLAYDVPVYGTVEIEATSFEEAVERVRKAAETAFAEGIWDIHDVDYQHPCEHRIVFIEDEDGSANVSDIGLTHHDAPWIILSAKEVAEVLADAEIIEEFTA